MTDLLREIREFNETSETILNLKRTLKYKHLTRYVEYETHKEISLHYPFNIMPYEAEYGDYANIYFEHSKIIYEGNFNGLFCLCVCFSDDAGNYKKLCLSKLQITQHRIDKEHFLRTLNSEFLNIGMYIEIINQYRGNLIKDELYISLVSDEEAATEYYQFGFPVDLGELICDSMPIRTPQYEREQQPGDNQDTVIEPREDINDAILRIEVQRLREEDQQDLPPRSPTFEEMEQEANRVDGVLTHTLTSNNEEEFTMSDLNSFWEEAVNFFKNGEYRITFTSEGIEKIIPIHTTRECINQRTTFKFDACVLCLDDQKKVKYYLQIVATYVYVVYATTHI